MMYDGWMWGDGWGWGGWILMTVVMVLFWAVVITAIVLAVRYVGGSRHTSGGPARLRPVASRGGARRTLRPWRDR